jgi:hypothetical protein
MTDRCGDDSSDERAGGMPREDALRECGRRDVREKLHEQVPVEVRPGGFKIDPLR